MYTLKELLRRAVDIGAADVFIIAGVPISYKAGQHIERLDGERVMPAISEQLIREIYQLANRDVERLLATGDDDFSFTVPDLSRFRVSTYRQRGSLAAVIRVISFGIPDYKQRNIPEEVMKVAERTKGLVLVTGLAGSGKSTTLACIIDRINNTRENHIITLEEPIEFLHRNNKSIISQREIGLDSENYITSLRACLRQAPDVILVGEMRDYETIATAMTAAETGHLVLSTLHTVGAANTIDRIIDVFPPAQQQQVRVQISMILQSVVSQQLIPMDNGELIPAFEIMHLNSAIRNLIRDSKIHQIDSVIATSGADGMITMDGSLLELVKKGRISKQTAIRYASNPDILTKKLAAF